MQIEPSKVRILADCIEGMAADAEDKGKDSFGIHLSLQDARMITRSLSAASQPAGGGTKMSNDITFMDCWHYVAPLLPVTTDFGKEVYFMIFNALKEAEKKRIAGKKKEVKHET